MRQRFLFLALAPVLGSALLLSGCDQAEQGRVLLYDKGTYLGKKDEALSKEQREDLRQRTRMQQSG